MSVYTPRNLQTPRVVSLEVIIKMKLNKRKESKLTNRAHKNLKVKVI